MIKIGFIGLGVMGGPMAGHLSNANYEIKVFNRSVSKRTNWLNKYKGFIVNSPLEAAIDSDFIFTCVGNDNDINEIFYSNNGILKGLKRGATCIDHTTSSASIAKQLSKDLENYNCNFIDAPVSGGQIGAEKGLLSIMCGGDQLVYNKVLPIISNYGSKIALIGDVGSGQLAKMVNQICIAGLVQALSEGINFGINSGIDMHKVLDVIENGAAGSWQMKNRGQTMLKDEFDFGFAVNWMRKDLSLCLEEARKNNSRLPVTSLVDKFYSEVQSIGGERLDTSSLIKILKKN